MDIKKYNDLTDASRATATNLSVKVHKSQTYHIIGIGSCEDTEVIIPSSIQGRNVSGIAAKAFEGNDDITAVVIPNTVISIGDYAFANCVNLRYVIIPPSVKSIGQYAFYNCSGLGAVYITDLKKWCEIEFADRYANPMSYAANAYLGSVPQLLTSINNTLATDKINPYAFFGYTKLTSVTLPTSVIDIGRSAFANCISLKTITINDNLQHIGEDAIYNTQYYNTASNRNSSTGCLYLYSANGASGNKLCALIDCKPASNSTGVSIDNKCYIIGAGAFKTYATHVNSVSISTASPLKYINERAFYAMNLSTITLPNNLEVIGDEAFYGCDRLTSITIPNNVRSLGNSIFEGCTNLASISIGTNVRSIGASAFAGDIRLSSIEIPASIETLGESIFYNCINLRSIHFNGSPTLFKKIPDKCYYNCSSLMAITGNTSPEVIGESAFEGCSSIQGLSLSDSITTAGARAFANCRNLKTFTIGAGLTSLDETALSGCPILESIVVSSDNKMFSDASGSLYSKDRKILIQYARGRANTEYSPPVGIQLTEIKSYAFSEASNLKSITISKDVTTIGDGAFSSCYRLESFIVDPNNSSYVALNGSLYTSDKSALIQYPAGKSDSLTVIPASVTSIKLGAFANFHHLSYIYYEGTDVKGWQTIQVGGDNDRLSHLSVILYSKEYPKPADLAPSRWRYIGDLPILWSIDAVSPGLEFVDIDSENCAVASIGTCADLNIVIPTMSPSQKKVIRIESEAFSGCSKITQVTIPDQITEIGSRAFYGCKALQNVSIPNSVKQIGAQAFFGCSSLKTMTIPDSVTSLGEYTFHGCSSLTSVKLSQHVTEISYQQFYGCSALTSVAFPASITRIAPEAFYGCAKLASMTLHENITDIGEYAFYGCTTLNTITIPTSITHIKPYTFANNSKLSTLNIAGITTTINDNERVTTYNLKLIDEYAFSGCSSLNAIFIPDSVTTLGTAAFMNCSAAKSLSIGKGIKTIGSNVFKGCSSLTSISIPDNITDIAEGAFSGCAAVTSVTMPFVGANRSATERAGLFGYIFGTASYTGSVATAQYYGADGSADGATWYIPSALRTISISGTNIGTGVFQNCTSVTSVTLSAKITQLPERAFKGCTNLNSVTISSKLKKILAYAFKGCSSLTGVATTTADLSEIGVYAFEGCSKFPSFDFNAATSLTAINTGTFKGCSALSNFILPPNIKTIGQDAFRGCASLSAITFPGTVSSIEADAFNGCSKLNLVYVPANVPSVGNTTTFSGYPSTIQFWTPDTTSLNKYRADAGWSPWRSYFYSSQPQRYIFNPNGGAAQTAEVTQDITGSGSLKALMFTPKSGTGNYFVRWNTKSDGSGESYSDGQQIYVTSNEDVHLYAIWSNIYYVTFFKCCNSQFKTGVDVVDQHTGPQEYYQASLSTNGGASFNVIDRSLYTGTFNSEGTSWKELGRTGVPYGSKIKLWVNYDPSREWTTSHIYQGWASANFADNLTVSAQPAEFEFTVQGNVNIGFRLIEDYWWTKESGLWGIPYYDQHHSINWNAHIYYL